jgi:hypothetical protein
MKKVININSELIYDDIIVSDFISKCENMCEYRLDHLDNHKITKEQIDDILNVTNYKVFKRVYDGNLGDTMYIDYYYFTDNILIKLVFQNTGTNTDALILESLLFTYNNVEEDNIDEIIQEIYKLRSIKNQDISIITKGDYGFTLSSTTIDITDKNVKLNYGKSGVKLYDKLVDKLINTNYGLFLLHGLPGTGKSYLIKYLLQDVSKHKKIIYMPAHMVEHFVDPGFIKFINNHPNSILILEDAENILQKRNELSSNAVSNILNLTNGLLNEILKIQVIATFNMSIANLDDALLRPGRLIINWEFGKLTKKQVTKIAKKINKKIDVNKQYTLSEIYNSEPIVEISKTKKTNKPKYKKIGF